MQAHLSIEAINAEGLRGVTATVDIKGGDSIALLPTDLIIEMGSERHSSAVRPFCMADVPSTAAAMYGGLMLASLICSSYTGMPYARLGICRSASAMMSAHWQADGYGCKGGAA